jgi:hypothetical protein
MSIPSEETPFIASNEVLALHHVLDNVLNIPMTSDVYSAFTKFWIFNINDLMNLRPRIDLQEEYTFSKVNDKGESIEVNSKLPAMVIRNIELLQQWYIESSHPNVMSWFPLNQSIFNEWKNNQLHLTSNNDQPNIVTSSTPLVVTSSQPYQSNQAASFQRSIKRSPSDYTKFKDDNRWKQWHRHLKATANSHGLSNVLDPTFIPSTEDDKDLFQVQQTFMYSVFEQCLHTTKSRHVVQTYESTADAQSVYVGLLQAYEEDLTTSLAATDLRSELTLM